MLPGSGGGETLRYVIPVDDVPERFQVVCPSVLVFKVISVFPDVAAEDRSAFRTGRWDRWPGP